MAAFSTAITKGESPHATVDSTMATSAAIHTLRMMHGRGFFDFQRSAQLFRRLGVPTEQAQSRGGHALRSESEALHDFFTRRRSAETFEPEGDAIGSRPTVPSKRSACFNRHAGANRFRQHAVAIRLILLLESVHGGLTDNTCVDSVRFLQLFLRRHAELNFRTRADQNHLRLIALCFGKDVRALRCVRILCPAAIEMRNIL